MKAQDLKLDELVRFAEGRISLHGRRLALHDLRAFTQLRQDLLTMVGPEQARRIFTRFGYFWGEADAAALKRVFKWDSLRDYLLALPRMHSLQGMSRMLVKRLDVDPQNSQFLMDLTWHDSGEIEDRPEGLPSNETLCWLIVGYASGFASWCQGREIFFIEHKCCARGERVCAAIGKDRQSWGDEIKEYLRYYRTDDIVGKIRDLSARLQKATRELAVQRRQLGLSDSGPQPAWPEVRSSGFQRVLEMAHRVGPYDSSILITGESGVGKEVLARYIHRLSIRSKLPFLAVNCGALPETLLESELFGHKAGAFTGAIGDRVGLFEQASGSTLFLDEIGDISPNMQVKLLRVLQEKEIMPVGASRVRKVDVRIIAATNKDLHAEIAAGRFREDLYYRLSVIEIDIPPLRQRQEDVLPLARTFVSRLARRLKMPALRLDAACLDYLLNYAWPGNVRELENAIERAAVLSREGTILPEHLPPGILQARQRPGKALSVRRTLAQVEKEHIQAVLESTGGNRTQAAQILAISPATLWRKLRSENQPS